MRMAKRVSPLLVLFAAFVAMAFATPLAAQDDDAATPPRVIVIGTAPVAGVYFPAGGAICNLVNRARRENGLRCLVESTGGSADNLRRLRSGEIDFALVQSDWQYLAVHGNDDAPFDALRSVFALHGQAMTVLVHPDSGISEIENLPGHRIALGPEGSGLRMMAEALLVAFDWRAGDFEEMLALDVDDMVTALCDGRVDAVLLPVSHPNGAVALAAALCGARPIPVVGRPVEALLANWPFYSRVEIPGGLYRGVDAAVTTYGPRATLVSRADLPDAVVYDVVRAVMGHLDDLAAQHPALAGLDARTMVDGGNSAEIHPGALRYYREQGWK